ncbi:MAG: hypothetical protein MRZ17_06960 [Acholeplasmataceae bacterium]|nr:hypothetical protein [Acholeplasmataceae bacterium]
MLYFQDFYILYLLYWICNSRYNGNCKRMLIHDEQMAEATALSFEYLYSIYSNLTISSSIKI